MLKSNYSIMLNKDIEPIYSIESGETLKLETVNAYGEHFETMNELMDLIAGKYSDKHHHPLTGPIDIEEAEPGDVLKVTINDIKVDLAGQALSKSAGIAPIEVTKFADRAPIIAKYEHNTNKMKYMNGMYIDYKPMIGMIGTAPKDGFIKTGHAGRTGGNLDIPFITTGCSVYLPVRVQRGKLFLGGVHAAQGYGELGGIALEASAEVSIAVEVLRPRNKDIWDNIIVIGTEPFSGKKALGIVGVSQSYQSLNEAVFDSYKGAINILSELCPTVNKGYICNIITAIGHSMNGQAFSKTSESTCIINILEEDIRTLKKDSCFSLVNELDSILFKAD